MRAWWGMALLAALAVVPAPLPVEAQTTQRDAVPRAASPAQAKPFGLMMQNREQLGLTDQQIARLEGIAQRLEQQNGPLLQRLREAGIPVRPERRDGVREMTPEQRRELRERLEAHRPTLMQMRQNTHAAMEEARVVLTPEQQERMREIMRQRDGHGGQHNDSRGQRPPRGR
jgi:Spy/CpxP family protein refolding chaperone